METEKKYSLSPTFGDSFGTGWNVMFDNFLRLFLVIIILSILAAPLKIFHFNFNLSDLHGAPWFWAHDLRHNMGHIFALGTMGIFAAFFGFLAMLYAFLVKPVFEFGGNMIFVQAVRKIKPDFEYLIKGFMENYLHIILANLLVYRV